MKKKLLAMLLAAGMVLSLAACGETSNEPSQEELAEKNQQLKNYVYDLEELESPLSDYENFWVQTVDRVEDNIYVIIGTYEDTGESVQLLIFDQLGNYQESIILDQINYGYTEEEVVYNTSTTTTSVTAEVSVAVPLPEIEEGAIVDSIAPGAIQENVYKNNYVILSNNTIAFIENRSYADADGMWVEEQSIVNQSMTSEEIYRLSLDEFLESSDDNYIYINSLFEDGDGNLVIMTNQSILVVASDGSLSSETPLSPELLDGYGPIFYYEGNPVMQVWNTDYSQQRYVAVDVNTGAIIEEIEVPDSISNYGVFDGHGIGYDLYLSDNLGVYGFNMGDTQPTKLLDIIASDLDVNYMERIIPISETELIALYSGYSDYTSKLGKLTKVPAEEVPDKALITIATIYAGRDLIQAVINFNGQSDEYKVLIEDYADYNTSEDYTLAKTQLENDIITGDVADIIYSNNSISVANYASKGLLADLYELFESDETIAVEDYSQNVFEALEYDGGLYQMPTRYYIATMFGKESIFGDTTLTWENLSQTQSQYPEADLTSEMTKSEVLNAALRYSFEEFVDMENGTVSFDSDAFKNLLEFANTFPDEIDYSANYDDPTYWEKWETQYIEDRTLLYGGTIDNMADFYRYTYSKFLEPFTAVGFPNSSGINGVISVDTSYSIVADSPYVEGAWEFVKTQISKETMMPEENENNNYNYTWGLPILQEALEADAEKMMEKDYWINEKGEKEEYDYTTYINGEEVIIEPASQEEVDKWLAFVNSVTTTTDYAMMEEIFPIIEEEVAAYFSGQKSTDEVVGIIQSRVSLYVNENS